MAGKGLGHSIVHTTRKEAYHIGIVDRQQSKGNIVVEQSSGNLRSLASQTASKSKVFGLDSHTLSVDGSQVGVLKE